MKLFAKDRLKIGAMGKATSALKVQGLLERHCLVTLAFAQKELGLSLPAVGHAMARLHKAGIVREISGKRRRQVFAYQAYWKLLARGMSETRD